jgi:hypothetical protein
MAWIRAMTRTLARDVSRCGSSFLARTSLAERASRRSNARLIFTAILARWAGVMLLLGVPFLTKTLDNRRRGCGWRVSGLA